MKHYALEMWPDEQPRLSWQVKITGPRKSRMFLQNFIFSLTYVLHNGALQHHENVQYSIILSEQNQNVF